MFSPLHKAVLDIEGYTLLKLLSPEVKINIDVRDVYQRTPLHWATLRGDLKAVILLLEAGADVNAVDINESAPISYAVSASVQRIVELLLLRGADVNVVNGRGDSPLHYAARHKDDLETVQLLVNAGAEIDKRNHVGNTPLAGAAITNKVRAGRYLLQHGANRYSRNKYGDMPLHETVYHASHEFLKMLLDDDTRLGHLNNSGNSILHGLALEGDVETARILSARHGRGLDPDIKNLRGEKAADILKRRLNPPDGLQEAFLEVMISLNHKPES